MPTIVAIFGVNLSSVPYILVFMSDGSAYAYNVVSESSILIANPGTFSDTGPGDVSIWQGQIALIVDPGTGYFRWPGSAAGSSSPSVTLISAPTAVTGAAGNVEAGSHQWAVTYVISGVETNLGNASSTLTPAVASQVQLTGIPVGVSGTTARKIYRTEANQDGPFKLLTTISDNTTTSFLDNVADGGLGADSPPAGAIPEGSHAWAVSFITGGVESSLSDPSVNLTTNGLRQVLVYNIPLGPGGTTARNLYRTPVGDPNTYRLVVQIPNNTSTAYSDIIADTALGAIFSGDSSNLVTQLDSARVGTTLAVFSGRVWIANNRTVQFTAPNTFNDFSISNAAGSFIMTDSNFIGPIQKLLTALDVMWIFGESAVNQLSNVSVLSGTTTTIFSNINVSSSVGTTFPRSVISFLRQVEFATPYGIIQQIGVTPQRVSEKIDGTYQALDLQQPVTAGLVVLNSILCYGLMVTYLDPDTLGTPRKIILLVSFDGKWFIGSQGDDLRLMTSVEYRGNYRLFGADEHNLRELFVEPHYPIHKLKSPFIDMGDLTSGKDMVRAGVLFNFDEITPTEMTFTPQSATGPNHVMQATKTNVVQFQPAQGSPIQFEGTEPITITSRGYNFPQWQVGNVSQLVGFDLSINNDPFEILAYALDVESLQSWGDFR